MIKRVINTTYEDVLLYKCCELLRLQGKCSNAVTYTHPHVTHILSIQPSAANFLKVVIGSHANCWRSAALNLKQTLHISLEIQMQHHWAREGLTLWDGKTPPENILYNRAIVIK